MTSMEVLVLTLAAMVAVTLIWIDGFAHGRKRKQDAEQRERHSAAKSVEEMLEEEGWR